MDLESQMTLLGGVAHRRTIVQLRGRREVDAALRRKELVRLGRERYALPHAPEGLKTACRVSGVLSHRSAAAYWGWEQKNPDGLHEVTFPRTRRVDPVLRKVLIPHWSDLPEEDVVKNVVTTQRRTLVDCMRMLPFEDALSIVDSALRQRDITKAELLALARDTRGRGRTRIIAVAEEASHLAANAFESTLRAQALLIPGLTVVAQRELSIEDATSLRPDLVDVSLRIVIEAEGFEEHAKPKRFSQDCRRYNLLVVEGWYVVRFTWHQVMFAPAYVQRVLRAIVALAGSPGAANVASAA